MKKPGCTIIGTVVARPEKREELLKILSSFVTPTRTEPGCINYDFHCDAEDPNVFVFYENFVSQQALDKQADFHPPLLARIGGRIPTVQRLMGRLIGLGVRPEHIHTPDMLASDTPAR